MHRAIALTLALSAFAGHAHADPTLKIQQQYVKPVLPPGPPPCIQCGLQFQPNFGSQLTTNPQVNSPVLSNRSSALIRR